MSNPIIRMDASDLDRPEVERGPANFAIEGEPIETTHEYYSKDGRSSGVWSCTPGRMLEEKHEIDEFCTIIGGKLGLIDNRTGKEQVFTTGDSFFLPKGSDLTWVIYETVSKFYLIAD